jgi:hypothetical protein
MADEQIPVPTQEEVFRQALEPELDPTLATTPEPEVPQPAGQPPSPPAAAPPIPPEAPEAAIPSWRLREEADARRAAEDRARALEARLGEVARHMQQTQQQPDFFANPDAATQTLITRTLQPYVEMNEARMMYMCRMIADTVHGGDSVAEAERAFLEAHDSKTLDPADYERVVQSPNRYDAAVRWYKRQAVLSSVGDDPNAWFEQQLEARMSDPQFQAQVLERARSGAATRPSETRLPPSLSRSTAVAPSAPEPLGDMGDRSLFEFAMQPKRRTQ